MTDMRRESVLSYSTDATVLDQKNQLSGRIQYEGEAVKLEELLNEDHKEAITQDLIAGRKSPNRLGTTYQTRFVEQALQTNGAPQEHSKSMFMKP